MKKMLPLVFLTFGVVMILGGITLKLKTLENKIVEEKKEDDTKCMTAFLDGNYSIFNVVFDDKKVSFDFLNCNLEEKKELNKYYLYSPNKGFNLEIYLNSSSVSSTALEIFDKISENEYYLGNVISLNSYVDDKGELYRIIDIIPEDKLNLEREYVMVRTLEKGKSIVFRVYLKYGGNDEEFYKTLFDSIKIQ